MLIKLFIRWLFILWIIDSSLILRLGFFFIGFFIGIIFMSWIKIFCNKIRRTWSNPIWRLALILITFYFVLLKLIVKLVVRFVLLDWFIWLMIGLDSFIINAFYYILWFLSSFVTGCWFNILHFGHRVLLFFKLLF